MRAPSSHPTEYTRRLLNPPIRILVVGSRSMTRARLRLLTEGRPGLTLIAEAVSHSKAIAIASRDRPDLIFLDGHGDTRRLILTIRELAAATRSRVLVVDDEDDIDVHRQAVRNGAEDMVILERLPNTMTAVLYPEAEKIGSLTELQLAIIRSVALGLSDKKIAARLSLSDATVRAHLKSAFKKLGVTDRLDLVVYSFLNGIVEAKRPEHKILVPRRSMTLSKGPRAKSSRRSVVSR